MDDRDDDDDDDDGDEEADHYHHHCEGHHTHTYFIFKEYILCVLNKNSWSLLCVFPLIVVIGLKKNLLQC